MACVVVYDGKRGRVFRAKYVIPGPKQKMVTVGRAADGWTRAKALERAHKLEWEAWHVSFAAYAAQWLRDHQQNGEWKPRTAESYERNVIARVVEFFGDDMPLSEIREGELRRYLAHLDTSYAYATVCTHLAVLRHIWRDAMRVGLVQFDWPHKIDRPQKRDHGRAYRVKPPRVEKTVIGVPPQVVTSPQLKPAPKIFVVTFCAALIAWVAFTIYYIWSVAT